MKLQWDEYSCGPVAICNAYFHRYGRYPNISIRRMCMKCSTTEEDGTERWDIVQNGILDLGKPTYNINRIMEMDAFILLYSFSTDSEDCAHYVFVIKNSDQFHIYNYADIVKDTYVNVIKNKDDFLDILKRNPRVNGLDYPLAWSI